MTYSKNGKRYTMSCDHKHPCNSKETYVYSGTDDLQAYRALQQAATGWTSTSTQHICPRHDD